MIVGETMGVNGDGTWAEVQVFQQAALAQKPVSFPAWVGYWFRVEKIDVVAGGGSGGREPPGWAKASFTARVRCIAVPGGGLAPRN